MYQHWLSRCWAVSGLYRSTLILGTIVAKPWCPCPRDHAAQSGPFLGLSGTAAGCSGSALASVGAGSLPCGACCSSWPWVQPRRSSSGAVDAWALTAAFCFRCLGGSVMLDIGALLSSRMSDVHLLPRLAERFPFPGPHQDHPVPLRLDSLAA